MKNSLRITSVFLGIYAGLLAIQHGIFEILQGSLPPGGLMFNAIGLPCQSDTVWHACFPAMSLIPNLLISGIAAMLVGLGMVIWVLAFGGHRYGRPVLGALSVLALLVGGGFVPVFIGLIAAATARPMGAPVRPGGGVWRSLAALWPWPLVLMGFWLPGSWLLGHTFSSAMLSVSSLLFVIFDLILPVLAAVSALAYAKCLKEKR